MRWLLLDSVHSVEKGKKAKTISKVPKAPYSPEVLFIEMMAQTGGLLVGAESDYKNDIVFAKIEHASFRAVPEAGTPLEIEAVAEGMSPEGGWLEGVISSAGGVIAKAKILLMSVEKLVPGQPKSITFHDAFMNYFKVRDKIVLPL